MLAPLIPIITAIAGAGSLAATGYELANQPGTPKAPATPAPSPADAAKTAASNRATQEAALSQQLPNLQALTGGSLSPEALMRLSEILSGQGNTPGIGASSQDLIAKLFGGGGETPFQVSAGNTPTQTGATSGLVQSPSFGG
jgi:hypothetical protein